MQQLPPRPAPPEANWSLALLGSVEARCGDRQIDHFPTRHTALLLARLALQQHRCHPRAELTALLWPKVPAAAALNRLRQALAALRKLLHHEGLAAPLLRAEAGGLRLDANALVCDATDFERSVLQGDTARARSLYQGPLMPGFEEPWVQAERVRLQALFAELLALEAAALNVPPLAPMPAPMTRFFGRAAELAALAAALHQARLVTVTGPGGCGKTRLVLELARQTAHAPGVQPPVFVPLADCRDVDQVLAQLRTALRLGGPARGMLAELAELTGRLACEPALLFLDNFEHLLPVQGAELVRTLLARLPTLRLVLTSRRALGVPEETEVRIGPLPLPDGAETVSGLAQNAALAMLADRVRCARPDFKPTDADHADLARLCHALDGLPLALELAAARSPAYTLPGLRQALERPLALLAPTPREGPARARHDSIRRTIEWSWQLLQRPAQRVLEAMSVFRGACSAADVQAVLVDLEDGETTAEWLASLVTDSLLSVVRLADGEDRFRMLALVREFVDGKLSPARCQALRLRHRVHIQRLADGLGQRPAAHIGDGYIANVHEALHSALEDDAPQAALQLGLALRSQWDSCGIAAETLALLVQAADASSTAPASRVQMFTLLTRLHLARADTAAARARAEQALSLAGDDPLLCSLALSASARVALFGDWKVQGVEAQIERALLLAGADPEARALALLNRGGLVQRRDGDAAAALVCYEAAARLLVTIGARHEARRVDYARAGCLCDLGRYDDALAQARHLEADCCGQGEWALAAVAANLQGVAWSQRRHWQLALQAYARSLSLAAQQGLQHSLSIALWNHGRSLAHLRRPVEAARMMGFSASLSRRLFGDLSRTDERDLRLVRRLVQAQIGGEATRREWLLGESWSLMQALARARSVAAEWVLSVDGDAAPQQAR